MNMITIRGKQFDSKQLITLTTILMTGWILALSLFQPDSFIMSFASHGTTHTILRAVMLVALLTVLVSRPPRSQAFRIGLGIASSVVLLGACISMMDYQIGIVDAILYLEASIILALEAIENQRVPMQLSPRQSSQS